jgi:hypothetical protein
VSSFQTKRLKRVRAGQGKCTGTMKKSNKK